MISYAYSFSEKRVKKKIYKKLSKKQIVGELELTKSQFDSWEPYCYPELTSEGKFSKWLHNEEDKNSDLYESKKIEARDLILSRYSESDQFNMQHDSMQILGEMVVYNREATAEEAIKLTEAKDAKIFIDSVLNELHTNKHNADFSIF